MLTPQDKTKAAGLIHLRHFFRRPCRPRLRFRLKRMWAQLLPEIPLPVHLPFGAWWLASNDVCGDAIFSGDFEEPERRFVASWLRPGMTVVDIGAHHGFYTLLASRKVGPKGRVLAFEPSPREHTKLIRHLKINRCKNVSVHSCALGSVDGEADLFVVEGRETGCNSLRPPNVSDRTKVVCVRIMRLDGLLKNLGVENVDFMKVDAEGAELEVLKGAVELLARRPRPVIICEAQDIRTEPWGYRAGEILAFLSGLGYGWFVPLPKGTLEPLALTGDFVNGNFVAVPEERLEHVAGR